MKSNFRILASRFKESFPDITLYIRKVKLPEGDAGDCDKIGFKKFLIRINKNCSEEESYHIMQHEVSHALAWDKEKEDHNIEWGKMYSKCYKVYEKFLDEDINKDK